MVLAKPQRREGSRRQGGFASLREVYFGLRFTNGEEDFDNSVHGGVMKRFVRGLGRAALTIGAGDRIASAKINCDQVRRYLKTGRSAEDVAETMVIDIKDVRKCQETGDAEPATTPTPAK